MKALVTGGAGFIGSNLINELISQDYEVVCLDINPHGHWNKNTANYVGDVCNYPLVDSLMKDVDYVFHLAADVRIQDCIKNPIQCYHNNVIGTATVLEAARNNDVRNVVFSSTCAIYECKWLVQSEGSPEDASLNPYASSKKSGEDLCKLYSTSYGLHTTILRYFNVYGERQHTSGQYAPVVGVFMKQQDQGLPLTITGDGSQRRDFIHVNDVVQANILAARSVMSPTDCKTAEIYNVGSGVNYSIKEIADTISTEQEYIDKRTGEIQATQAEITKIKEFFGWTPKVNLREWLLDNHKDCIK